MKDFGNWLKKRNNQISKSALAKAGFKLSFLFQEIEKTYGKNAKDTFIDLIFNQSALNKSLLQKTKFSIQEKEKILINYENTSLHTVNSNDHIFKIEQLINNFGIDYTIVQNCLLNFAIADLGKMAMSSPDIELIHSGHEEEGSSVVNSDPYMDSHPPNKKYTDFLKSPKIIESRKDLNREGISKKTVHKLGSNLFMTKPFHAPLEADTAYAKDLISGWATMATKNLFNAGGIGHLCENVTAGSSHDPIKNTSVPVTVHEYAPDYIEASYTHPAGSRTAITPRNGIPPLQFKQIAALDFLTNNLDRHGNNLMQSENEDKTGARNLLAIDHERNFQYYSSFGDKWHNSLKDYKKSGTNLLEYLRMSSGIKPYYEDWLKKTQSGDEKKGMEDLKDWWKIHRNSIKQSFLKDVQNIKDDDTREHIINNFTDRHKAMDDWADSYGKAGTDFPKVKNLIPRKETSNELVNRIKDLDSASSINLVTAFLSKMEKDNKKVPNRLYNSVMLHFKEKMKNSDLNDFVKMSKYLYQNIDNKHKKNSMGERFAYDLKESLIVSLRKSVFGGLNFGGLNHQLALKKLDKLELLLEEMRQNENFGVFGKKNILNDLAEIADIKDYAQNYTHIGI